MQNFVNTAKIISIANTNDVFMTCDMIFLTTETNLNRVRYTEAFVDYVVSHKDEYVCIPLVVDIQNLLDRNFDDLTHLFKNGRFGTTQIGSFYDFYKVTNDNGVVELRASIRIPKRNTEVCGLLAELHASEEGLKFSYEICVSQYTVENDVTIVDAEGGYPIGTCIVSIPAVPASTCQTLVAELIGLEGEKVEHNIYLSENTEMFVAELSREQFDTKLRAAFRAIDREHGYNLFISDVFAAYFVAFDYENGDYLKFEYEINDGEIVVKDEPAKVERAYVQTMVAEAKGEPTMETLIAEKDAVVAEKETVIAEKETAIAEFEAKVNELNEDLVTVGEKLTAANEEIANLTAAKEQLDAILAEKAEAEKAEKKEKLRTKCAKVMAENEIAEVAELIENLDEAGINAVIAEKYVAIAEADQPVVRQVAFDHIQIAEDKKTNKYITM